MLSLSLNVGNMVALGRTPAAAAPALTMPAIANMTHWWDASTFPAQADNTAVAGDWVDKIAGVPLTQSDTAKKYLYKTSALNGRPGMNSPSGGRHFFMGRPASFLEAMSGWNSSTGYTIMFACRPTADGMWRALLSAGGVLGSQNVVVSTSKIGRIGDGGRVVAGGANTGFQIVTVRADALSNNDEFSFIYRDLEGYWNGGVKAPSSSDYKVGGADSSEAGYDFAGDIFDMVVWNKSLTQAEIAKAIKYLRDKYDEPLPWAGLTHLVGCDGNSYSAAYGAWFSKLVAAKGFPIGCCPSVAVGGRKASMMQASAVVNWQGLSEEVGLPIVVAFHEYYNENTPNGSSLINYSAALHAAAPEITRLVMTAPDNGRLPGTSSHDDRAGFNAGIMASSTVADVKCPLHLDTFIGVEGACPDSPGPYGPYHADDVGHPTDAGHVKWADYVSSYWDSAVGHATGG